MKKMLALREPSTTATYHMVTPSNIWLVRNVRDTPKLLANHKTKLQRASCKSTPPGAQDFIDNKPQRPYPDGM
jgi:hypothetical protein